MEALVQLAFGLWLLESVSGGHVRRVLILLLATVDLSACGGNNSSPSAPTSKPTVWVTTLKLSPDTTESKTVSLVPLDTRAWERPDADEIGIAVQANSIEKTTGATGEIRWDPQVLKFSRIYRGIFYEENGAALTNSTHDDICTAEGSGRCRFTVTRPTSLPSISGGGVIVAIYLKRLPSVLNGSSPLQWSNTTVAQDGCTLPIGQYTCSWFGIRWKNSSIEIATQAQ